MSRTVITRFSILLLVALSAGPARADDVGKSRAAQIADLERQVAEVQRKLAELKAGDAAAGGKKPLTLADADTWRAVRGVALSPDGKWFAHRVGPNEGDGEVVLRGPDGKEARFPAGGGSGNPVFSGDSKWVAFGVAPYVKPGTAPGPRPKPRIVLIELATGAKAEIEGATNFQFNGEAATHLAFRKASGAPTGPPIPAPATTGSDLVLRELATGTDLVLGNVSEFAFDKKGVWLAAVIDAAGQLGNGVHLRDMKAGALYPVEAGRATYRGLTWNE